MEASISFTSDLEARLLFKKLNLDSCFKNRNWFRQAKKCVQRIQRIIPTATRSKLNTQLS